MSTSSESGSEEDQWVAKKDKSGSGEESIELEDNYSGDDDRDAFDDFPAEVAGADEEEEVEEDQLILPDQPSKLIAQTMIVPSGERRTSDAMSKAELSAVISTRVNQIEAHNNAFCRGKYGSARELAIAELRERMCPLELVRKVGIYRGIERIEIWSPNEMVLPDQLAEMM